MDREVGVRPAKGTWEEQEASPWADPGLHREEVGVHPSEDPTIHRAEEDSPKEMDGTRPTAVDPLGEVGEVPHTEGLTDLLEAEGEDHPEEVEGTRLAAVATRREEARREEVPLEGATQEVPLEEVRQVVEDPNRETPSWGPPLTSEIS